MAEIQTTETGLPGDVGHSAEQESLYSDEVREWIRRWSTDPPEPFASFFRGLDPTRESKENIRDLIQDHTDLTTEQRYALNYILMERWEQVVVAQSGERI